MKMGRLKSAAFLHTIEHPWINLEGIVVLLLSRTMVTLLLLESQLDILFYPYIQNGLSLRE